MDIEVAAILIGDKLGAVGPPEVLETARHDIPWDARPRVTIGANTDTTLHDVLDRGAAELKVRYRTGDWYGDYQMSWGPRRFVFDGQEFGARYAKFDAALIDGAAQWWFDNDRITLQDANTAREASLLLGNPRHLYVIVDEPEKPAGNGVDYWLGVIESLPYLQEYLQAAGIAGSLASGIKVVRKAVTGIHERSLPTGGTLQGYTSLFAVSRTTKQVATLLQLPEEDVPAICHFLGMHFVDGAWRVDNQPGGKEYRELVLVIDAVSHWHVSNSVRAKAFAQILAVRAGERTKQVDAIVRSLLYQENEDI